MSIGLLVLLGLVLVVVGAVVSWQRTLIPGEYQGTVENIVMFEVDQPGVDDWVSLDLDGREITTGNDALTCLRDDTTVVKSSWSRRVEVDGESCVLPFPRQAITDIVVPILLIAVLVAIALLRRSRGKPAAEPTQTA